VGSQQPFFTGEMNTLTIYSFIMMQTIFGAPIAMPKTEVFLALFVLDVV